MKVTTLFLFILLLSGGLGLAQQPDDIDSLKKALYAEKTDTGKIALYSELAFRYANYNTDTALTYVAYETAIADKINIPKFTANAINDLAIIQYYTGDYSKALANNKKALEIRQQIGDEKLIISSLNKIAVIYQELGNFDKAADYQLQVLKIAEHLNNENYIGLTLDNIAYLLQHSGRFNEAKSYILRALAIARKNDDTLHIATAYANMKNIFEHSENFDSAYIYQAKAIALFESINALYQLSAAYNDMGFLQRHMKNEKEGLAYYKKALNIAVILNSRSDQAFYSANVGEAFINLKNIDSAYPYFRQAIFLNRPDSKPEILRNCYNGLFTYYVVKNNHDSALLYKDLYKNIIDTINSNASLKQVNELQARYETEQKQLQIILLGEKNTVKQLSIIRRNIIISVIAGSFVIALVLGFLFYNRYKMKQNALLQQEIMHQQQLASRAVISAEELERKRIAGDLHDGIGQMFSAVKMNLSGLAHRVNIPNTEDQHLLEKTMALVDESCKEVRMISHQMMPNVLLKSGLTSAIRDFIDKIDESRLKITLETFGLQKPLDSNVETVLYRIIQESVNNVIKHANASQLDIQLHKDDQSITATIEDNGIGFDLDKMNDIQGIGLKSIKARVEFLDGKVDYDTAPGKGTLVAIYIPNKTT